MAIVGLEPSNFIVQSQTLINHKNMAAPNKKAIKTNFPLNMQIKSATFNR